MRLRLIGLTLALSAFAWAGTQTCTFNGVDLGCSLYPASGSVTAGTFPLIGPAYQLGLPDITDEAEIYNHPNAGTLGNLSATFGAFVPGAATNGSFDNLAPYLFFEVYPSADAPSTYALVIVANSGFNSFTNNAWYTDGIGPNSTVHIELVDSTWAADPALAGITNPDWLTCCSDLPTLSQLDATPIPGGGTWGDLMIHGVVIDVGNAGGSGGPYTAYVNGFDVTQAPEPSTGILFVLSLPLIYFGRKSIRRG